MPERPASAEPTRPGDDRSRRVLIITNDFPPRQGGIQSFVHELARRLPPDEIAVYCSRFDGDAEFDRSLPFPVHRHPTGMLLPTPAARARAGELVERYSSRAVWFGAAAPLALMTPSLRARGVETVVASTHGHEIGWALLPGSRQALRRIGDNVDVITYLSEYTRRRLAPALGDHPTLVPLVPGVDVASFARTDERRAEAAAMTERLGLAGRPVVVCVSRLVPRKGQDVLIEAWPRVLDAVPGAALLLVGRGRYEKRLRRQIARAGLQDSVILTGGVPAGQLAACYQVGDVFAMPCRTRRFGMDVEGLGIVFLEASAAGLPVIAGDSGGAPDAVRSGETGWVVDGRDVAAVAARVVELLRDPDTAARMGRAGHDWVADRWQWDASAALLAGLLGLPTPQDRTPEA